MQELTYLFISLPLSRTSALFANVSSTLRQEPVSISSMKAYYYPFSSQMEYGHPTRYHSILGSIIRCDWLMGFAIPVVLGFATALLA